MFWDRKERSRSFFLLDAHVLSSEDETTSTPYTLQQSNPQPTKNTKGHTYHTIIQTNRQCQCSDYWIAWDRKAIMGKIPTTGSSAAAAAAVWGKTAVGARNSKTALVVSPFVSGCSAATFILKTTQRRVKSRFKTCTSAWSVKRELHGSRSRVSRGMYSGADGTRTRGKLEISRYKVTLTKICFHRKQREQGH